MINDNVNLCAEAVAHYSWQTLQQVVYSVAGYSVAVDSRILSAA